MCVLLIGSFAAMDLTWTLPLNLNGAFLSMTGLMVVR